MRKHLPIWSIRMKRRKKTKRIQTELLFDLRLDSAPVHLDLAAERRVELERLIAELPLNVALEGRNPERR
jgi:hypothetical protein